MKNQRYDLTASSRRAGAVDFTPRPELLRQGFRVRRATCCGAPYFVI